MRRLVEGIAVVLISALALVGIVHVSQFPETVQAIYQKVTAPDRTLQDEAHDFYFNTVATDGCEEDFDTTYDGLVLTNSVDPYYDFAVIVTSKIDPNYSHVWFTDTPGSGC